MFVTNPSRPCPCCGRCPTCGHYGARPYAYPNPWYYTGGASQTVPNAGQAQSFVGGVTASNPLQGNGPQCK